MLVPASGAPAECEQKANKIFNPLITTAPWNLPVFDKKLVMDLNLAPGTSFLASRHGLWYINGKGKVQSLRQNTQIDLKWPLRKNIR